MLKSKAKNRDGKSPKGHQQGHSDKQGKGGHHDRPHHGPGTDHTEGKHGPKPPFPGPHSGKGGKDKQHESHKKQTDKFVRLELLRIEIIADNKETVWESLFGNKINIGENRTWKLYFMFRIPHFMDSGKDVWLKFPSGGVIPFTKHDENVVKFIDKSKGDTEGHTIYVGPMPDDHRLEMEVTAIQSKETSRNVGEIVSGVTGLLDSEVASRLGPAMNNPYVAAAVVANKGLNVVSKIISKTDDKQRGWQSLDTDFNKKDFKDDGLDHVSLELTGKELKLLFKWKIEDKNGKLVKNK